MMMMIAFWAEVSYSSTRSSVFSRRKKATSRGFVQSSLGLRKAGFVVQVGGGVGVQLAVWTQVGGALFWGDSV